MHSKQRCYPHLLERVHSFSKRQNLYGKITVFIRLKPYTFSLHTECLGSNLEKYLWYQRYTGLPQIQKKVQLPGGKDQGYQGIQAKTATASFTASNMETQDSQTASLQSTLPNTRPTSGGKDLRMTPLAGKTGAALKS